MIRSVAFCAPLLAFSLFACGQASQNQELSDAELDSRAEALKQEADQLVRDKLAESEEAEPLPSQSEGQE